MATQILNRRGTAAAWALANPVLGDGELGFETDTKIIKVGDGTTAWNSLTVPYLSAGGGTMTGDLDMDGNSILNFGALNSDLDFDGNDIDNLGAMLSSFSMQNTNRIMNVPDVPADGGDAINADYADRGLRQVDQEQGDGSSLYISCSSIPAGAELLLVTVAGSVSQLGPIQMTLNAGVSVGDYRAYRHGRDGGADTLDYETSDQGFPVIEAEHGLFIRAHIDLTTDHPHVLGNATGFDAGISDIVGMQFGGEYVVSSGPPSVVTDVRFRAPTGEHWEAETEMRVYAAIP